jgi:glutathione S-transferase
LGEFVGREFTPQVADYYARLKQRPAFQRADAMDGGQAATFQD